jgi:hypothetical protein
MIVRRAARIYRQAKYRPRTGGRWRMQLQQASHRRPRSEMLTGSSQATVGHEDGMLARLVP